MKLSDRWVCVSWLIGVGAVAACGSVEELQTEVSSSASQCGPTWDAQAVELYNGVFAGVSTAFVARHERRVGHLFGVGCSGTLISDDLFLSAGHCGYQVNQTVRFDYQDDPNGSPRVPRNFTVTDVVEQEFNSDFDYAIVRLSGSPGREFGHANIAAIDPPVNSTVVIIGHPNSVPKVVHAGPVVDVPSNWFWHRVDTLGGSSGSGVLNLDGQLIGVHTNGGCNLAPPYDTNRAMRMSRLVAHSATLQALTRSKLMWRHSTGRITIWTAEANGDVRNDIEHTVGTEWTPIAFADHRILWKRTDGVVSLWVINELGQYVSSAVHGPFSGWTPVTYANQRILWRHTDGRSQLWTVDANGNYVSHVEFGPAAGWTATAYANNRLILSNTSGNVATYVLDDAGALTGLATYGPFPGWSVLNYSNGELMWRHTDGRTSMWTLDRNANQLAYRENGPFGGWAPIDNTDRRLFWRQTDGRASYWTTNSDGGQLSYREYGPYADWTPLFTAGGRP